MILEFRFDQLHPRAVPAFERHFVEALPERTALSPLAGFWNTDFGNIDQVVQLWAYRDMAHREDILGRAARLSSWSALEASDLVQEHDSVLVAAAPFSPTLEPQLLGSAYELRIYEYEAGAIPRVLERWEEKLPARTRLSPLVLCGWSVSGRLSRWFHLWAYADLAERQRIRKEAVRTAAWPPQPAGGLVRQRNMLLVPSNFSPLR